jgi:hypothetical protein
VNVPVVFSAASVASCEKDRDSPGTVPDVERLAGGEPRQTRNARNDGTGGGSGNRRSEIPRENDKLFQIGTRPDDAGKPETRRPESASPPNSEGVGRDIVAQGLRSVEGGTVTFASPYRSVMEMTPGEEATTAPEGAT